MNRVILDQKRESYRVSIRKEWKNEMQRKNRQMWEELSVGLETHQLRLLQAIHEHIDKDYQPTAELKAIKFFDQLELIIRKPNNDPISTSFLFLVSEELYREPQECTTSILNYLMKFINTHPYNQMKDYKRFKSDFLNLLTVIVCEVNRPQVSNLKQRLLTWCTGTHCISVLTHCISQFPPTNKYPQLYSLLEKGLQSKRPEQAAQTIINIGRTADWDDLYSIYQNYPNIFNNLLDRMVECTKPDKKVLFGQAMIKLCQTYESVIMHYTLCGMGQLTCQLIVSQADAEISMGLRLLTLICYIKQENIHNYLLHNEHIEAQRMWERVASLHRSQNIEHRRGIYRCLLYFADTLTHEQMERDFFRLINCDILNLIEYGLRHEDNPSIVLSILQLIRILLYHSELLKEIHHVNIVAMHMAQRGLLKIIQEHQVSSECTSIQENCQEILKGCQRSHIEF